MANDRYEQDRQTLKELCPAKQYGIQCEDACPVLQGIRIPLSEDPRVFTAIDRSSYKWENFYKMRTSVERVNSRLDVSFGFEVHTIRGEQKMKTRWTCPMRHACNGGGADQRRASGEYEELGKSGIISIVHMWISQLKKTSSPSTKGYLSYL